MDSHLLLKIVHMGAVSLALLAFICRALTLFVGVREQQPNPVARKLLVGSQHLAFALIALTGVILLIMNNFQVQPWFYAKIILFFVLLSALSKAFKRDDSILLVQRRAGLLLAGVAFAAIIALVIIKPVFG